MATVEEILGPRPKTVQEILGPRPTGVVEPPPFNWDGQLESIGKERGFPLDAMERDGFSQSMTNLARPFLAQGYNAYSALNRGTAHLYEGLDLAADFIANRTGTEKGGLFNKMAKISLEKAEHWKKRAQEVGINFLDEIVSEAISGFTPGVAGFALDVGSYYTIPAMRGFARGEKTGENPFVLGLVDAAQTKSLHMIFQAMNPLNKYLRTPIMGTVFGVQEAAVAPEGEAAKAFVKGFGTGAGYSIFSPGGQMGLGDLIRDARIEKSLKPEARIPESEVLKSEPGVEKIIDEKQRFVEAPEVGGIVPERGLAEQFAVPGEPRTSPRKYWKTVEEAERTAPEVKERLEEIQAEKPVVNIVQSNRENLEKAYSILEAKGPEEALKMAESGENMTPVEKGALFNVLMERAQKDGLWDKFVSIMDTYSLYLVDLGRGVQIASVWAKSTPMGFIRWAEKQLDGVNKKYGWADTLLGRKKAVLTDQDKIEISQEFMRIQQLPEGAEKSNEMLKLIDRIAVKVPPSVSELIDAYRYQNMLSGPQTQERNIFWNMTNTFVTRPIDLAFSGVLDYFGSGLRGTERKAYLSDVPVYLRDVLGVVPTALTAFKNAWKQEAGEIMQKPDLGVDYKTPLEQARTKQIPKVLTIVQRFMEAQDKFNSILIAGGEKARLIKNGAGEIEAEMKAKELAEKYLVRDKLDPSDPSLSYFSKAIEGLGVMVEGGRKMPVLGKPLAWIVPFIRTPIKVGVDMIERSPLGWARGETDLNSASKLASGAMVTGLGAMMAYLGEVTWAAPTNAEEKEWFFATGRKPFSFKVGEKWIPVWYLGPFALAFIFPAAVKYYTEESKEAMTNDMADKVGGIAGGIAKFVASQTSAQSIGNFFSFMSGDIDYNVKNQVGFTIGQFIPAGAMVRYVNKALDPVYRKAEGIAEQTMRGIPYLSEDLPARTKPFMEESRREFFNLFLPYDVGLEDQAYESLYPMKKMEARQAYLDNKMNQLIKKMNEGDYREKHFDEMIKIMNAAPKVFE